MTLMHFDPFRDLERLTEQALGYGRGPRALPMEALRRGDGFLIALDAVSGAFAGLLIGWLFALFNWFRFWPRSR